VTVLKLLLDTLETLLKLQMINFPLSSSIICFVTLVAVISQNIFFSQTKIFNDFNFLPLTVIENNLWRLFSKNTSKRKNKAQIVTNVLINFLSMVPAPVSDQRQLTLTFCSLPLLGRRNKGENKVNANWGRILNRSLAGAGTICVPDLRRIFRPYFLEP
jgi:hypothetical protein